MSMKRSEYVLWTVGSWAAIGLLVGTIIAGLVNEYRGSEPTCECHREAK